MRANNIINYIYGILNMKSGSLMNLHLYNYKTIRIVLINSTQGIF